MKRVLKAISFLVLAFGALAAHAQTVCSGNGSLDPSGQCQCFAGFAGPQCQYSRFTTCNGHGDPSATGVCDCDPGFAGASCGVCDTNHYSYPACRFCTRTATCNNAGSCNSSGLCQCDPNYAGANCSSCNVNYYGPTCSYCLAAVTCSGNGVCTSTGSCACSAGFTGAACDIPTGPAITCLNPTVAVPSTAQTCSACPTPAEIFSVQDPSAQCTVNPACPYAPGTTSVQVSCTSATGASSSAQCPLTVTEAAPQIQCPDVTVACTGGLPPPPQGASVCSEVGTTCVLDTGSPWIAGGQLSGATGYTCTTAAPGGAAASCTGKLVTTDVGPTVTLYPGPANMWPPNHKMHTVELSDCIASAVDACTGLPIDIDARARIVRVTSDEPEDGSTAGDGHTCSDIQIASPTSVQLRRERDGGGNGRLYTIHFEVANDRGATTSGTCQVGVPHSARSAAPLDDGARYCVGEGCPPQAACGQ